ncbi:MAG TPA: glycoside hydrolase family 3 N-terminal domain-containing protein [Sedimentisphaerales bacterium]|nr:glycoside hydrolase family 3 N-terminal domain-containing protein [Sedimentisphaerales bacterium]HRS12947.1 glycoside hydrolase family 3 N-terminal domain-containing protein [Sedimentisphaerales bacterium]HRV49556.1 glycoside hydrolase family 3 N-terminal domain-containing protein [Sedimentisphaerales bacterium]
MRALWLLCVAGSMSVLGCSSAEKVSPKKGDALIEAKVRQLMAKMTLEEKVGQMTQITLETFAKSGQDGYLVLDPGKLRDGIVNHHIGSILNCGGQARTPENWQEMIAQMQDIATKETRLGIPILYGIDSIHGANYVLGATIFPQNIAMAATGNVVLMEKVGEIAAMETRAVGIPWNFNPVLDLARQPMWPRVFETFGEDAYLASVMGAAYIRAQQGDDLTRSDKVATCMKHYLGYSVPRSGRDRTPAYIPDRELRQHFLKPFESAVRAGTVTCMVNSSEINGVPVHSSKFHLTDLLRGELGFEGFVVSDWADIENLYTREKVAKDRREAVQMAVMAGVDMSMVPYDYSFYDTLLELVRDGEVPMSRIDRAVADILRVKFRLGLFEKPYPNKNLLGNIGLEASRKVNLQAAQEAITLLKNEQKTLPLAKSARVLVTGPTANLLSVLNSGWTLTWQGNNEALYPQEKYTILEAIRAKIGDDRVSHVDAVTFDEEKDIGGAVAAAQNVDAIVACIGEPAYCETPGNIDDLTMSEPQLKLVEDLAKTGKPIVLVLVEGRPRVIRTIVDDARAILTAYCPGMEGGQAVADVLFGDVNPSGRLPYTYPRFAGGFTTYDHKPSEETGENKFNPQWPFGHGLSYTSLVYRALQTDRSEIRPGDTVAVTVEVTNTGDIAAKETVQLYLSDLVASVTPAVRQLKRFQKVDVPAGQTRTVRFELGWDDLAFIGRDNVPVVEPGQFKISVGELSVLLTVPEFAK